MKLFRNLILIILLCFSFCFGDYPPGYPPEYMHNYLHMVISSGVVMGSYFGLEWLFPKLDKKYRLVISIPLGMGVGYLKEILDYQITHNFNRTDLYWDFLGVHESTFIILLWNF